MAEKCEKEEIVIQGDKNVKMGGKKHMWPPFELNANVATPIVLFETVEFSFFFIHSTGSALPKNFRTLLKSPLELPSIEKNKHTLKFLISPN